MTYVSPTGETVSEQLVSFVKADQKGEPQLYKNPDGFGHLNADLYDSKRVSGKHAMGLDYNMSKIPRVDGKGNFTGIVTIQSGK